MDSFRNTLKKRLKVAAAYNAMVLIIIGAGYAIGREHVEQSLAIAFATGLFVGVQFVMIYHMTRIRAALKDEIKLKELYIAENDERNKFIESQIGGTGVNVIVCGLALGTIVAGFFNEIVFFTVLAALLFAVLVKGVLKVYYNKKV